MGLKVMKFHSVLHLIQDMLLYGTPSEFDTGSNESHHKVSKMAAKLTQRKESSFNYQTALRLTEFLCVALAMMEVMGFRNVWEYFDGAKEEYDAKAEDMEIDLPADVDLGAEEAESDNEVEEEEDDEEEEEEEILRTETGGTRIIVFVDEDDGEASFKMRSRSEGQANTVWLHEVVVFLNQLQDLVLPYVEERHLPVMTMHKRGQHVFYGHPNFRSSGPWKDWVIIDWGDHGRLPSHIWCFVKLSNMPTGNQRLQFGGVTLQDEVYAVVEVAEYNLDEEEMAKSDLFTPLILEVDGLDEDGDITGRRFYLASTESFVGPCCVVPDIGGPKNTFFQVKPRREWSNQFVRWLEAPHNFDVMEYSDEEPA